MGGKRKKRSSLNCGWHPKEKKKSLLRRLETSRSCLRTARAPSSWFVLCAQQAVNADHDGVARCSRRFVGTVPSRQVSERHRQWKTGGWLSKCRSSQKQSHCALYSAQMSEWVCTNACDIKRVKHSRRGFLWTIAVEIGEDCSCSGWH